MIVALQPLALGQSAELDLCTVGSRIVWRCRPTDMLVLDIDRPGTAWPTNAVVTIKRSSDGVTFYAYSPALPTRTAVGLSDPWLAAAPFVCAEVTTLGTGTAPIPLTARMDGGILGVSP